MRDSSAASTPNTVSMTAPGVKGDASRQLLGLGGELRRRQPERKGRKRNSQGSQKDSQSFNGSPFATFAKPLRPLRPDVRLGCPSWLSALLRAPQCHGRDARPQAEGPRETFLVAEA